MVATILKSKNTLSATFTIIETFAQIKQLSHNINAIMKTTDETLQQEFANKSNKKPIKTTTKFEFNLEFAKVSRNIKKIKR